MKLECNTVFHSRAGSKRKVDNRGDGRKLEKWTSSALLKQKRLARIINFGENRNQPSLNPRIPHLEMIASLLSREGAHTGRGRRSASSFDAKFKQGKADVLLLALKITLLLKSFSNGNGDEIFSYKTTSRFFKLCCDNSSSHKMSNGWKFLWISFLGTTP